MLELPLAMSHSHILEKQNHKQFPPVSVSEQGFGCCFSLRDVAFNALILLDLGFLVFLDEGARKFQAFGDMQ